MAGGWGRRKIKSFKLAGRFEFDVGPRIKGKGLRGKIDVEPKRVMLGFRHSVCLPLIK